MKNVFHHNNWNRGAVQLHVEPPPIPLIESRNDTKTDKYFVKIKFCRDPTSKNSDIYEFKIALFDKIDPEEFLLFFTEL